ncbi:MAG: hypothetical protein JO170_06980 [Verrucomicrobia bacterium]|nr:hypothetical protein [Verrucomicrobiota bacterium]
MKGLPAWRRPRGVDKAAFGVEADFPQAHQALLTVLDKVEPLVPRSVHLT